MVDADGPIVLHVGRALGGYDARTSVTDDGAIADTFARTISVD